MILTSPCVHRLSMVVCKCQGELGHLLMDAELVEHELLLPVSCAVLLFEQLRETAVCYQLPQGGLNQQ